MTHLADRYLCDGPTCRVDVHVADGRALEWWYLLPPTRDDSRHYCSRECFVADLRTIIRHVDRRDTGGA